MSASKPAGIIDAKFAKRLVLINGLVPAALLVWDAYQQQLGVNEVNFAIRTTGLIGLIFLVVALLITPLRKLTGWNVLIAVRRSLGLFGFFYIAAHFAIFVIWDRAGSLSSTFEEIFERVYLWFGAGALLLMIPLAITSTDGMVSRLGAKRWKLLHRLAYVATICGVVHYVLLVKADLRQPLAFGIFVAVLLIYRVASHYRDLHVEVRTLKAKIATTRAAAPRKRKFWSGELRVARIFDETHDVKTFRMVSPTGGPLPFDHVAGQYLTLALVIDGKRVNRSYTIASSPTRADYCEISVKRAADGYASKHLHATLREGSMIKVSAAAGRFYFAGTEPTTRVVLIAGGVGITPMMSIVRSLTDRCWTGDIYLVFSVRKLHDVIFETELAYLQKRFPNLHVCVTLTGDPDQAWDGERGQISKALLQRFIPDLERGPVLMCGPDKMMDAARKILVDMGVPDAEVSQEAFISPPASATPDAAAATDAAGGATGDATGVALDPATEGELANVRFERAGKTAELPADLTILEAAEEAGVTIPFECRSGICGQCKTKLISGKVTMDVQDALTATDKSKGLILACQARAVRDVVVDA